MNLLFFDGRYQGPAFFGDLLLQTMCLHVQKEGDVEGSQEKRKKAGKEAEGRLHKSPFKNDSFIREGTAEGNQTISE